MARNSFDININLKGFPKAHQQLNKTKDGMERMRESTSGLRRQIGALRNNILLFSFAVGGAAIVVNKFVSAAAGFESVRARLVGLTGGVKEANEAFDRFNAIAGTTPFQLQDVVNAGAQLEAFGVDSKATLSSLTDLAAFMGTNATEAASALGRAFAGGAGAADILRERGILQLIKDSEGIEDLTKLTLPEFRSALINALTDPNGQISGSAKRLSETYQGAVSNMQDAVVRFQATVGDILLPTLTEAIKGAETFIRGFNKKEILEAATAISIVATTFTVYKISADLAAGATLKFQKSLKRIGMAGLAMLLGLAIDKMLEFTGAFESVNEETKDFEKELEDASKDLKEYKNSLENATEATKELDEETNDITGSLEKKVISLRLQAMALDGAGTKTLALVEHGAKLNKQDFIHINTIDRLKKAIDEVNKANEKRESLEKRSSERKALSIALDSDISRSVRLMSVLRQSENDKITENIQKENLRLDTIAQIQDALDLSATAIAPLVSGLDIMNTELDKNTNAFKLTNGDIIAFGEENNKLVEKIILSAQTMQIYNDALNANAEAQSRAKEQAQARIPIEEVLLDRQIQLLEKQAMITAGMVSTEKETNNAAASINLLAGAMQGLKGDTKDAKQMFSVFLRTIGSLMALTPSGQAGGALLNLLSGFVGHTGGLIKDNGIQRFATGGMVQGQDNVPIMAQAGEFIMRREAVQNIGVQNLADMNRSGQGGGVTVNISAPLVDETVIDHIIPAINKATNRDLA
ncbi:tail length tape measure protein [uncultured Mediterranean phage]|nr:tail length tape measure protein [uncultured Mediterranean phage]